MEINMVLGYLEFFIACSTSRCWTKSYIYSSIWTHASCFWNDFCGCVLVNGVNKHDSDGQILS